MEMRTRENTFWIIFDTSQYSPYYGDVHELLATPAGLVMRYQYRDNLVTQNAQEFSKLGVGAKVLLAYTQRLCDYPRTGNASEPSDSNAPYATIPTRLATMKNVIRDGENYYYDFIVEGYPDPTSSQLAALIKSLADGGGAPPDAWVATSDALSDLADISRGPEVENWQAIVRKISEPPMQFSIDAFWRLRGPFTQGGKLIKPRIVSEREAGVIRRIKSEFLMTENKTWIFQLATTIGNEVAQNRPDYQISATSSSTDAIKISGSGKFDVRHYDEKPVEYASQSISPFRTLVATIDFNTEPEADWPAGPRLSIRHVVRKSHAVSVLGILLGISALLLAIVGGSDLFKYDLLNGIKLLACGAILGAASKYLLTGKLEFSK